MKPVSIMQSGFTANKIVKQYKYAGLPAVIVHNFPDRMDHVLYIPIRHGIKQRKTHDLIVISFRVRAKPFSIAKLLIIRMPVNRKIMDL